GAMHELRAMVEHARIVRRNLHRRDTLKAIAHVLGVMAVTVLRVDPVARRLPGLEISAVKLALTRSVNDVRILRMWDDRPSLGTRPLPPQLDRVVDTLGWRPPARGDQRRGV